MAPDARGTKISFAVASDQHTTSNGFTLAAASALPLSSSSRSKWIQRGTMQ